MIRAVERFSEAQRPADTSVEAAPGIVSERRWLPLDAVGLCVPSGRTPLPSSLVMTAVPARVAGVTRIAVVTPDPAEATLVVARELGIDEVYAVGGAQAVAALAYGTESIPAVDAIVGPGQRLRDGGEAPRLESRADRSARRAERGRRDRRLDGRRRPRRGRSRSPRPSTVPTATRSSSPPDRTLAEAVARVVAGHANVRVERVEVARRGARAVGGVRPRAPGAARRRRAALAARVRNAGSVFVGCSSVIGDYAAGATHVLPTGGLARSTGGLGIETFLKPLQVVTADAEGARRAAEVVAPLARVEGLPLHAAAVPA